MMDKSELKEILKQHNLWLQCNGGKRADLTDADLTDANLPGADIDFASWPLWCGSQKAIIDEKQAKQILAHGFAVARKFWPDDLTQSQIDWLNDFHRIKSKEFEKFKEESAEGYINNVQRPRKGE